MTCFDRLDPSVSYPCTYTPMCDMYTTVCDVFTHTSSKHALICDMCAPCALYAPMEGQMLPHWMIYVPEQRVHPKQLSVTVFPGGRGTGRNFRDMRGKQSCKRGHVHVLSKRLPHVLTTQTAGQRWPSPLPM